MILGDLGLCTAGIMRCSYGDMRTVHKEWFAVFIHEMHLNLGRKLVPLLRVKFYVKLDEVLGTSHVTVNEMSFCRENEENSFERE